MRDKLEKIQHVALYASGGRRLANRLRFGADAPRPHQKMQVTPDAIGARYWVKQNKGRIIGWWRTAQVLDGDWDRARRDVAKSRKYKACEAHFHDGKTWEDTGIIDYMMKRIAKEGPLDQCQTRADVLARYTRLDNLWEVAKTKHHLPASPPQPFDGLLANDDVLVHVDRDGQLLFGNQGFHRLAIAKLAGLSCMTVSLGVVHPDALRSGAFQRLLK